MKLSSDQIQQIYDISLEIGRSLDLYDMLKISLNAFIKKLKCVTGIVFRLAEDSAGNYTPEMIFSIPYALITKCTYSEIALLVPEKLTVHTLKNFNSELPKKGHLDCGLNYQLFELKDFGFLALLRDNDFLDEDIAEALNGVNIKLGQAANLCLSNEKLEESELRFRHQQELLPEMMCEINHDGIVTYVTNYAAEKLGYSLSEIVEKNHYLSFFIRRTRINFRLTSEKLLNLTRQVLMNIECSGKTDPLFRSLFIQTV